MVRALIAIATVVASSSITATATAQPSRPFQVEFTGDFRAADPEFVFEAHLHAGYSYHLGFSERASVVFAAGIDGTMGAITYEDPRSRDGSLEASRRTLGGTLRLGLAWSRHSWPELYAVVGLTGFVADTDTDSRFLADAGRARGSRLSVGFSAPGSWAQVYRWSKRCPRGKVCRVGAFWVVPNTLLITREEINAPDGRSALRWGASLGWSL